MSGRKEKEKRRELRLIHGEGKNGDPEPEDPKDPRDKLVLEALSEAIKDLPDDASQRTQGARLLLQVHDKPHLANSEFLAEFSERYKALLRDTCKALGYEGIYLADPKFGALGPGEAPRGVFRLYQKPQKLIVFGGDDAP